jgi:hypothetical protein
MAASHSGWFGQIVERARVDVPWVACARALAVMHEIEEHDLLSRDCKYRDQHILGFGLRSFTLAYQIYHFFCRERT